MVSEPGHAAGTARERAPQHVRERPVIWQIRQQHEFRKLRVASDMVEPGRNHLFGSGPIHERGAERSIGVRPSDENGKRQPIAKTFNARRKKAKEPPRHAW
jgi:hypothetical protein